MLSQASRVSATIPAQDIERAKSWYKDKLGLEPAGQEEGGGFFYDVGNGSAILLFHSSGKPSGEHTQAAFDVDDVESEVRALQARGVVFEEFDVPGLKTVNGIATVGDEKGAWFKDSEGNMLAIAQGARR